jgi:DAACS family dicarboxylate/amino acid:cation (Na+ or H+) symporter
MAESIGNSGTGMKLHTKILLALVIGATLGILANSQMGGTSPTVVWLNTYIAGPIGQIFLRLLFMVVMPLVFASIALGVAGLGDLRKVGRVGGKAIGYFLGTTFLAATFGLIIVSLVRPGEGIPENVKTELMATYAADASTKITAQQSGGFGINTFVEIVTRNPVKSAADGDMLGVIFFGLMFGAALTQLRPERAKPMIDVLNALEDVVIKI